MKSKAVITILHEDDDSVTITCETEPELDEENTDDEAILEYAAHTMAGIALSALTSAFAFRSIDLND